MKSIVLKFLTLLITVVISSTFSTAVFAQQKVKKYRFAKLEIYPDFLDEYKAALAEHTKTAVQLEPGVLALQAVYDLQHPTQVTVFEVYASEDAYQAHLKTKHFLKYKNGTLKMVKSLELIDVLPIAIASKKEFQAPQ